MAFTVAEVVNGAPVAYPYAAITALNPENAAETFVSVQSVTDPNNRLWVLDTGSVNFAPVVPGGPNLSASLQNTSFKRSDPRRPTSVTFASI